MGWLSRIKRVAKRAKNRVVKEAAGVSSAVQRRARSLARTAARRASSAVKKHGTKLLKRAAQAAAGAGATYVGGPAAGLTVTKLVGDAF